MASRLRPGPIALLATLVLSVQGQPLYVPNGSFESPATPFVDNRVASWQKTPKPFWYDESGGFTWDQLSGVFKNTEPGKEDHIPNTDGAQGFYLFAVPENGILQDGVGAGAVFTAGKAYRLSAGLVGGAGGMTNGVSLGMSLYYRDAAGSRVVVVATNIVYDPLTFPNQTNYVDVEVRAPAVQPGDAWVGKPIGIQFLSTVNPTLAGGYWDIDHVRLSEAIEVTNGSFESPTTAFVDNRVDGWIKNPKPDWYDESGGFSWDQLSGVFRNTEPGKEDHLENLEGSQAFYLFAIPANGLTLDDTSGQAGATGSVAPLRARLEPGHAYALTVAVQGGGGGMTNGVTLDLGLYYHDDTGAEVGLTNLTIVHDPQTFPSRNRLVDFEVRTAAVRPTDPWAGRNLGIRILSTVDPTRAGGYWNLDAVRLTAHPEPALLMPRLVDGAFECLVRSEPGTRLEVQASDDLANATGWRGLTTLTNLGGFTPIRDASGGGAPRYYRFQTLPPGD